MPKSWVIIKLGDVIGLKSGIDLTLDKINENNEGIPYLTGASCFNDNVLLIDRWTKYPTNISKKGELLITVKGTIGKMAFNDFGDLHIARQIMSIDVNKSIEKKYVLYYLLANKGELIDKSSSLIPGIRRDAILNLPLFLPPYYEQLRIVSVLEKCFKTIKTINKEGFEINYLAESVKHKILDSVFGENSSYKSYFKKQSFTDDVEIFDFMRRPINSSERKNRISKASQLYPYYGSTSQVGFIDDYLLEGEYVLLGEDAAPFLDKNAEKAYIVSGKFWVNNHAHILKSKTNNKFLKYYLDWFDYHDYVSGTTRLKLNQAMMKKIPIISCPNEIKNKIVSYIEAALKIIESVT